MISLDLDRYTRVYFRRGTHAHLIHFNHSPNDPSAALCRRSPEPGVVNLWRGTGSQDEYERAAALPLCTRCERMIR